MVLIFSENRAAASLAYHYSGGYRAFISAMDAKAKSLSMIDIYYVELTGMSIHNDLTAQDLTKLLIASQNSIYRSASSGPPPSGWSILKR